jgi:DTW domain-containing protein YfiP
MNLAEWRIKRGLREQFREAKARGYCPRCLRPPLTCYCGSLKPFDPKIQFVILIHGREAQKRIATGRMAHLSLENSLLISGYDYSGNSKVNALLEDPGNHCMVLYPGEGSLDLASLEPARRASLFPPGKNPVVFVIDGTWITARKTMQRSANLRELPRVCFQPGRPSNFRVRKQPQENFFSTIEAIHETIELLGPARGFDTASRAHDSLLQVFDRAIDQQIELSQGPKLYCQWSPKNAPRSRNSLPREGPGTPPPHP